MCVLKNITGRKLRLYTRVTIAYAGGAPVKDFSFSGRYSKFNSILTLRRRCSCSVHVPLELLALSFEGRGMGDGARGEGELERGRTASESGKCVCRCSRLKMIVFGSSAGRPGIKSTSTYRLCSIDILMLERKKATDDGRVFYEYADLRGVFGL